MASSAKTMSAPREDLELAAERLVLVPPERVWARCSSKEGFERWWSPEDLRTTVKRFEPRPGGEIVLSVRYAPAMLGPDRGAAFRAAGVPISFVLRGRIREWEPPRRIGFELTLSLDRGGSGIESWTRIELTPAGSGTHIRIVVSGPADPHRVALGRANLEGQLDRLAVSLEPGSIGPA